ncbi:hypothetical protein [Aureivirga sp. CE67]|uniref:hypothetical protein n=1 Tax=Aureivirga sp. CE67 TaxID=1788983 RepID=UPI0018CBD38C|nr:hypothetical protein [Aureivirga sp. CE67]
MKYYVNKTAQKSGEHEVHSQVCYFLPNSNNCIYLGEFSNCKSAINEAKKYYHNIDGCYHCSNNCHTR